MPSKGYNTLPTRYKTIFWAESTDYERMVAYLESTLLEIVISPLHDRDRYDLKDVMEAEKRIKAGEQTYMPAEGAEKKPHWHVIVNYHARKKLEQAQELFDPANWGQDEAAKPYVSKVDNWGGMVAYLIHRNQKDKYQYEASDVLALNGADISGLTALTDEQMMENAKEILTLCKKRHYTEFYQLADGLIGDGNADGFKTVWEKNGFFSNYLRSKSFAYSKVIEHGKELPFIPPN